MDDKYSGVTFSNDLKWSKHIANMTNNLDIERFTSNSACIAFHMRVLVLPKLFEYILILLLLICSKCFCLVL